MAHRKEAMPSKPDLDLRQNPYWRDTHYPHPRKVFVQINKVRFKKGVAVASDAMTQLAP